MIICITTSKHVSYNPRVVKEADALTAAGHNVTVVTVCNNNEQARLDISVMVSRKWRLATVAYRRQGVVETLRWLRFGLRQRFCTSVISLLTHRFSVAERAQGREYPELRRLACSVKADLYIAHHVEALGAASAAAHRHSARFVFDAEDFHSGMFNAQDVQVQAESLQETVRRLLAAPEHQPKSREQLRIEYLERKYLPRCDYITAASEGIAEAYALKYNVPLPTTILNVFPLEPRAKSQESGGNLSLFTLHPSHPYRLYWYSQVIGPGRGLEEAVRALALVKSPCELHLRGTALPDFAEHLTALAAGLGVGDHLFLHPPCPPDDLIAEAAQYNIGLALENTVELNRLICVTNKMFTYMNAGLAIIATDTPGQRGIMAQAPKVGVLCRMNDAESLAEAVNRLLENPELLISTRQASRRAAEERFNWGKEAEIVVRLAEGIYRLERKGAKALSRKD
jgi:glycosyltransferase involved in cell wall biosynthesis